MHNIVKLSFILVLGMGISQCGSPKKAIPISGNTNTNNNSVFGNSTSGFDQTGVSSQVQSGFDTTSTTAIPTVTDQSNISQNPNQIYTDNIYDATNQAQTTDAGGGLLGSLLNGGGSSDSSSGGLLSNLFSGNNNTNSGGLFNGGLLNNNNGSTGPIRNVISTVGGFLGGLFGR